MQDWEPLSARKLSQELRVDDRPLLDQDDEAIGANNGHHQTRPVGPVGAMCGRLRVGKKNLHFAALVGAAMCSAYSRGTHDRWP
jgi:hypothetical protein